MANITGVHIDHVVRIDFEAFQKIIDAVGGVTVYLDKDFVEPYQWSEEGEFRVPAGKNHMDGITALYYTRSRYSTSDFDRARRQQQVLLALRDRVMSLGVLTKPTFAFQILDILGNHVRTDATPQEIRKLIDLARTVSVDTINTKVLDTSAGGLLSQDTIDGQYVLLPRTGTYEEIRALAKNLLQ
ncbi:MAG: Cell envelope-related transcriptional attenuator [Parcubacteria group bacterium GW2011_GWA2_47_8]|nr:MAG: Cell envelope-related transcriptional attenuator [Parcubacteria group bacterium GW2011_GWA2_47_8]